MLSWPIITRDHYAADKDRAAYYWEAQRDGLIVACEYKNDGTEERLSYLDEIPKPFTFHAIPYRPTDFRAFCIPIEYGMKPIWLHVVNRVIQAFTGEQREYEALIFGREHPSGEQEVMLQTWMPDVYGEYRGMDAIEQAKAVFRG